MSSHCKDMNKLLDSLRWYPIGATATLRSMCCSYIVLQIATYILDYSKRLVVSDGDGNPRCKISGSIISWKRGRWWCKSTVWWWSNISYYLTRKIVQIVAIRLGNRTGPSILGKVHRWDTQMLSFESITSGSCRHSISVANAVFTQITDHYS